MSLFEKRQFYKCGYKFVTLEEIPTWSSNSMDSCIHFAAGKRYLEAECQLLGGCERGRCKVTGGYRLPAKYIIHSVGPIGENADLLSACTTNALDTLKEHGLRSIAFPTISTGTYGYPKEKAVPVVLKAIRRWLKISDNLASIDRIIFVRFNYQDIALYNQYMHKFFPL
ncbi:O-acetyl-ADP-ribose deacetylase macrod2 [Tyrophagus putrescentiae]|nr:O-acetyl-ADP-ribose deacetylase macrod2 [Tyrophagus putrescentiae]